MLILIFRKKGFVLLTIGYILLPSFLFLLTWVRADIGVLSFFIMVIAAVFAIAKLKAGNFFCENINFNVVVTSITVSFLLCCISEFGMLPYKSYDYMIHNYKYHLLATKQLPLYDAKHDIDTCYYLGFYMVPAFLGKFTKIEYVKYFSFFWIWLGVFISFVWFQLRPEFFGKKIFARCVWLAAIIAGAYISAILPVIKWFTGSSVIQNNGIVLNNSFVLNQVPVFTRSLSESTQHMLPALLGISFFLCISRLRNGVYSMGIVLCATIFWSPFATIGLAAFAVVAGLKALWKREQPISGMLFYIGGLLGAFYPIMLFLISSESTEMKSNRFIWQSGATYWFVYYLLYVFSCYGIWVVLWGRRMFVFDKPALITSLVVLLVLGFFQMGFYNDLNIRASIASQVVISLSVVYAVVKNRSLFFKEIRYTIAVLFFLLNSISLVKFYYERFFILKHETKNSIENPVVAEFGSDFYEFIENAYPANGKEVVNQYSLRKGSFFELYLLRK